ncbi:MAG: hypothetical protein EOO10_13310 [Chitinophagaceae bacterium]|nr:MAG: hypothetical protein EOO10_13310 [Chitinophagaceae bacterium]
MDFKDFLILDYLSQFDSPVDMTSKDLPHDLQINVPLNGSGPDVRHNRLAQLQNIGLIKQPYAKYAIITDAGRIELQRYKDAEDEKRNKESKSYTSFNVIGDGNVVGNAHSRFDKSFNPEISKAEPMTKRKIDWDTWAKVILGIIVLVTGILKYLGII